MVLTKVGLPRTVRQPAIDIDGLWVRRTRFHEPAMQDPSKGADELPQKGFAKKKKGPSEEREKERVSETESPWPQKGGRLLL